jgi:hypothetical protein
MRQCSPPACRATVVCLRVGEPTGAPVAPSSADGWCVDRLVGETGVAVSFEFQSTAVAARLASLLEAARPIPLTRSEVRLDKRAVYGLVAELRTAVRAEEAAGRIEAADAFRILSAAGQRHHASATTCGPGDAPTWRRSAFACYASGRQRARRTGLMCERVQIVQLLRSVRVATTGC